MCSVVLTPSEIVLRTLFGNPRSWMPFVLVLVWVCVIQTVKLGSEGEALLSG